MPSILTIILLLFPQLLRGKSNQEKLDALKSLERIAFGSCNNEKSTQPLWKDVIAQRPDLWIWGGDNVYADWDKSESVALSYQRQNDHPDYALLKKQTPIIGTWDDHDYGRNNAGGDLSFKHLSQQLHLDFMEVPSASARRKKEGIYTSFNFGSPERKIKIIILDNRYFKGLEADAPILGNKQWEWLEEELRRSDAHLHFFVSGLSIFSPTIPYTEEWWHFPIEVHRMQRILKDHKVKAPVFLTGDKHFSSIFKFWGQLEFMASGLTHTAPRRTWWYLRSRYPVTYFGLSYGLIDISWKKSTPRLRMVIRNGHKDIFSTSVIWKNGTWEFK